MKGDFRWVATAVVATLVCLAFSETAGAYERTKTCDSYGTYSCEEGEQPKAIAWPMRCVQYKINRQGSSDFPSDDGTIGSKLQNIVTESFQEWNKPSCSDFTFVGDGLTSLSKVRYKKDADWDENINLIVWRDEEWPHAGMDGAYALTSVTYNSKTGRIADADIEMNSAIHEFTHFSESKVGETSKVDMGNTLVHEIGHFVGLDHSSIQAATMYRSAKAGETKKRSLHPDDIDGLCAAYPGNDRSGACQYPEDFEPAPEGKNPDTKNTGSGPPKDEGICSVGAGPVPRLPILLLCSLVALVGLPRRRS